MQLGDIYTIGKEVIKRMSNRNNGNAKDRHKKQKKTLLFSVIAVMIGLILAGVAYAWSIFGKMDIQELDDSEVGINEDLSSEVLETLDGYTNIALFGLDNRSINNYASGHSDAIMIASINNKTKDVKIVSLYRDTYLNVGGGKYAKANAAYQRGGVTQAIKMLNMNLDLDITEYICVDWAALIEAIDALGGIEIELTSAEVKYLNQYVKDMSHEIGSESKLVSGSGVKKLTGAQATAYARIRYTAGNDFKRSSRQRIVLEAMLNKAKDANVKTLIDICNNVFDDISTSLKLSEILSLAKDVNAYNIASTSGFPFKMTTEIPDKFDTSNYSIVAPVGLSNNVAELHKYLFETEDYEPSTTVRIISDTIVKKTGVTEQAPSINVDEFNNTAGQTGTDFKEEETEAEEMEEETEMELELELE